MMMKDRQYSDLLADLRGKHVLIWTCNTCARLSNAVGGEDSSKKLSESLKNDGVNVVGIISTSASCLEKKIRSKYNADLIEKADLILSMTCNVGAVSVSRVFQLPVINPIVTLGPGLIDEDGKLFLVDGDGIVSDMKEIVKSMHLDDMPFV